MSRQSKLSSIKSLKEHYRYKSGLTQDLGLMPSAAIKRNPHEAILEVTAEEEDGLTVPDLDGFTNCNACNCSLNEDERIINYRFMK